MTVGVVPSACLAEVNLTDPLDVARALADRGGYVWKDGSGSPVEIVHRGEVILPKQARGTYCCGYTFAVAMRTAEARGLLADKSADEVRKCQKEWFGATPDSAERQCALAMQRLGIGKPVKSIAAARPGDFVQLWRTDKSGHSVVLVELVREGERVVGLRYRSSQKSTDGVGERDEFFSDVEGRQGRVDRRRTYAGRLDRGRTE
jgi:hypothetical protein